MKHILPFLTVAMLLAACTQDDPISPTGGVEGASPLHFTASIGPATRATTDGSWEETEYLQVQIVDNYTSGTPQWSDGTQQTYTVTVGGVMTKIEGTDAYWQANGEVKAIRAWYDADNSSATTLSDNQSVKTDQSGDGYTQSDFLFAQRIAEFTELREKDIDMTFYHQVAKVKVNILKGDETPAGLSITGLTIGGIATSGTFTAPALDGTTTTPLGTWSVTEQNQNITPHAGTATGGNTLATYEALVIPQTVNGNTRLFTISANGYSDFVYTPTEEITWQSGMEYTYNITIKGSKLEVSTSQRIGWDMGSTGSGSVNLDGYEYDSSTNTYEVSSANGLKTIADLVNNNGQSDINITLTEDITLTDEWTPIGSASTPYTGTFDGGEHTITGLVVKGEDYAGLFGYVGINGKVQNLRLEDVQVSGSSNVGAVAGANVGGAIENCTVSGTVTGSSNNIGGIVGFAKGSLDNPYGSIAALACISACDVIATGSGDVNAGGIIGANLLTDNNSIPIIACCMTGDVTAANGTNVGGLAGYNEGEIYSSYQTGGKVTGTGDNVGAIVGENNSMSIHDCYWNGEVSTEKGIGYDKYPQDTSIDFVDNTNCTWSDAKDGMNGIILSQYNWNWEISDDPLLPLKLVRTSN